MLNVASFNLCNLSSDTPTSRLERVAAIIATTLESPAILAVQEIATAASATAAEPIPATASFLCLTEAIERAGGVAYEFREIAPRAGRDGGLAGAHIRVGVLFDPAQVQLVERGQAGPDDPVGLRLHNGRPALTLSPGRIEPTDPAFEGDADRHWLPSRKALACEFVDANGPLFVIVCHLKSMRAEQRRHEAYAKKQRHAQAELIRRFALNLLTVDPNARLIVAGDMNDIPGSKTLDILKSAGLHNPVEALPRSTRYTRRHGNRPQALDHILVSPALLPAEAAIFHCNSDKSDSERASDHDPVLVRLCIQP